MIKKYRKKPIVIEALKYDGENADALTLIWAWPNALASVLVEDDKSIAINTLEGKMKVSVGDYIIRGIKGEFYPCKPDIFEATYEEVL